MGLGKSADLLAGTFSRLLHLRGARTNTIGYLHRYLDLKPGELFPAPSPISGMEVSRGAMDRLQRTSTLCWQSTHEVLCPNYRERHEGAYSNNLKAWARWIRPQGRPRRTALVYVHGWLEPGSWAEEATLFQLWQRQLDVDILHVALPFHGPRKPRGALFSGEFFWTADLVRSVEGVRQAVSDVRALCEWLRNHEYEQVGVTGVSLGGSITMLLACVEPTPDFIIPMISHLALEQAVEEAPILWRMKRDLDRWGVDREQRAELFRRLGLSTYQPQLSRQRQLWIQGRDDLYIDAELAEAQWRNWGRPPIRWLEGGHMTTVLHLGQVTRWIAEFLGELPRAVSSQVQSAER